MEHQTTANGRNMYYEGQHGAEEPADTAARLALVAERDALRATLAALRGIPLVDIGRRETPCGECHLQPGERCDICGASCVA